MLGFFGCCLWWCFVCFGGFVLILLGFYPLKSTHYVPFAEKIK